MGEHAVLWYVHDHGGGHIARARCVIPYLSSSVVVAGGPGGGSLRSAALPCPVVELPSDVPGCARPSTGPWHHAPVSAEVRSRTLALVGVIERFGCHTVVADVSMEVTVLGRLAGLRVVTVRQSGRRDDAAHAVGLASADAVWVPQHRHLEPLVDDADERWRFTGAFSRYDDAIAADGARRATRPERCRSAILVVGAGGTSFDDARWRRCRPPAGWRATIVGGSCPWRGDRVESVGYVSDLRSRLASADLVITAGGWASVAEAAAVCGRPMAIVPEPRPFDEQLVRAQALERAGLAVRLDRWPEPTELEQVAELAGCLDPDRWTRYYDGLGAQRAAALIEDVHGR